MSKELSTDGYVVCYEAQWKKDTSCLTIMTRTLPRRVVKILYGEEADRFKELLESEDD